MRRTKLKKNRQVCPGVLIGLFLFFLIFSWVSEVEVKQNNLAKIIQFFHTNFQPQGRGGGGGGVQFAVAINIPARQFWALFDPNNFLSGEDPETVKKDLEEKNLYQGPQMIAATPKGNHAKSKIHAERALIMGEDGNQANSPLQNLLNKDPNGCVIFYTYNSPCLEVCLNQEADDKLREGRDKKIQLGRPKIPLLVEKCILKHLSVLTNHRGPKAFVFSRVYRKDRNAMPELTAALKEVAKLVPVYKCDASFCVKTIEDLSSVTLTLTLNIVCGLCLQLQSSWVLQTALQKLHRYPVRYQSRPLKRRFVTSPGSLFLGKRFGVRIRE